MRMCRLFYGRVNSPYGEVLVGVLDDSICAVHFIETGDVSRGLDELNRRFPDLPAEQRQKQIYQYLKNPRLMLKGTPFQLQVWREILKIPPGKLSNYQEIARKINRPKAVRAVGTAVGQNPLAMLVPCHRVVHKGGNLEKTRYRWGREKKLAMIRDEAKRLNNLPYLKSGFKYGR